MALTRRQREVFDFIQKFIAEHGYSPSLQEIARAVGVSSVATIHKHVTHLVNKGLVRRGWNQNRSIELAVPAAGGVRVLPVLGSLAPGEPLRAAEATETLSVSEELLRGRGPAFAIRVRDDGTIGADVLRGDWLIVEDRNQPKNGEPVLATLEGGGARLGRFFSEGGRVRLEPLGSGQERIVSAPARIRIEGVLVGMIRRY